MPIRLKQGNGDSNGSFWENSISEFQKYQKPYTSPLSTWYTYKNTANWLNGSPSDVPTVATSGLKFWTWH